jgi:hypothetical protein
MTAETTVTEQREKRWYVIHTYSGYENKVKANLEHRIESMGMEDRIFQVLVPMEDEIEIRQGQRHTVQKKVYPGYVLVEMIRTTSCSSNPRRNCGFTSSFLTARIFSTSRLDRGVGLLPVPAATNPVTPGVLRTTYHESLS